MLTPFCRPWMPPRRGWDAKVFLSRMAVARPSCTCLLTDEPTQRCAQLNDAALKLAEQKQISEVVLVARWAYYDQGTGYGPDANEVRHLIDLAPPAQGGESQHATFARMLERTVRALVIAGKKVVIVAPVPEAGIDVPETLALAAIHGSHIDRRPSAASYRARNAFVLDDLAALRMKYGVTVVDPAELMCATGHCELTRGGKPLYVDHHHLSVYGAQQLSRSLCVSFLGPQKPGLAGQNDLEHNENKDRAVGAIASCPQQVRAPPVAARWRRY